MSVTQCHIAVCLICGEGHIQPHAVPLRSRACAATLLVDDIGGHRVSVMFALLAQCHVQSPRHHLEYTQTRVCCPRENLRPLHITNPTLALVSLQQGLTVRRRWYKAWPLLGVLGCSCATAEFSNACFVSSCSRSVASCPSSRSCVTLMHFWMPPARGTSGGHSSTGTGMVARLRSTGSPQPPRGVTFLLKVLSYVRSRPGRCCMS